MPRPLTSQAARRSASLAVGSTPPVAFELGSSQGAFFSLDCQVRRGAWVQPGAGGAEMNFSHTAHASSYSVHGTSLGSREVFVEKSLHHVEETCLLLL